MIRGVSGGEKRRVSIGNYDPAPSSLVLTSISAGEMLMPQGRCLSFMDAISNGLDASTTYDIMAAFKVAVKILKTTNVTSLLQVIPSATSPFLLTHLPRHRSPLLKSSISSMTSFS
jgi:ABC-type multidrug transport system ATPase subunit